MSRASIAFGVPGDIHSATGGYVYDRTIMAKLAQLGWEVELVGLGEGFPNPDFFTVCRAHERLTAISPQTPIVIDGLALGVMPRTAQALSEQHTLIALVHHPLALESGLTQEEASHLQQSETQALQYAQHVIVTSQATARIMKNFGVTEDRISVVVPGTEHVEAAPRHASTTTQLLSVGSITHRKGFDVLIQALVLIKDLSWQLTIVGDMTRDVECANRVIELIHQHHLQTRITITGKLPQADLSAFYSNSDVFVLASRFEGYGMAYAEAMAHGLPIIGTTAGAIPDTVPLLAGLLVEPDDVLELAKALRTMVVEPETRQSFAKEALATALSLPSWQTSAAVFANAILATQGAVGSIAERKLKGSIAR